MSARLPLAPAMPLSEALEKALAAAGWRQLLRPAALLLAVAAAFVMIGCAAPQPLEPAASRPLRAVAVATLATNPCEAAAAPHITRLAMSRLTAARLLDLRRISVADAIEVQRLADAARAALDPACATQTIAAPVEAIAQGRAAQARIDEILQGAAR